MANQFLTNEQYFLESYYFLELGVFLSPWEPARGAWFFPSVFDARSAPSKINDGSSIALDQSVAYVQGVTAALDAGPF